MISYFQRFFIIFVIISSLIYANEKDLLKGNDVHAIMEQIFSQHVTQKKMTPELMRKAIRIFITQADPTKIYFTAAEVSPYMNISDAEIDKDLLEYEKNKFPIFERLLTDYQEAVDRARRNRENIYVHKEALFENVPREMRLKLQLDFEQIKKRKFPGSDHELKDRQREDILYYVQLEKIRHNAQTVKENKNRILQSYEENSRKHENNYLYVDAIGEPLTPAEKTDVLMTLILKAFASSLDAHTSFYDSEEAYDMKLRLQKGYQGIGVVLRNSSHGVTIEKIIAGGPAAKSGLVKVNDRLVEINGKIANDLPFDEIEAMVNSKKNEPISLLLKRKENASLEPRLLTVKLTPQEVVVNDDRVDVNYYTYGDGIIGTIKLHSFYQGDEVNSEQDMINAIKGLEGKGKLKGLVLDLRDNSGGFLNQAVKVAGLFITNGVVVVSKYYNGNERFYRDLDGKAYYEGPLVILTSKMTASAAEIVAQALQDYGVAVIAGDTQTYGKGTIQSQTVTDNKGGASYFKVTVGKYYTVSGKTPQVNGVISDILVPGQTSMEKIGEKYLDAAIKADQIDSSYNDSLSDVDPTLRPWYAKYYKTTIQPKKTIWQTWIGYLKKKSEERIGRNEGYAAYLEKLYKGVPLDPGDIKQDWQMEEAVNIVKDMIGLQKIGQKE